MLSILAQISIVKGLYQNLLASLQIIKQNLRVDKQSASTISAENNLKPTAVLRNPDTNSGGCTVSTNTT